MQLNNDSVSVRPVKFDKNFVRPLVLEGPFTDPSKRYM